MSEITTIPQWRELLVRKRKMFENFVMELGKHATTPAHHEAIRLLLEMSRMSAHESSARTEAWAARSDLRI